MTGGGAPGTLRIAALRGLPHAELRALALDHGVATDGPMSADELAAAIVLEVLQRGGEAASHGVLEVLPEGYGFLREPAISYAASPLDAFVSPSQIRSLRLRPGHLLAGPIRAPHGSERCFALTHVTTVDGEPPPEIVARVPFAARTPALPVRRLDLGAAPPDLRPLAFLSPWALGHRVLVHAPPRWPAGPFLARLAAVLQERHPTALFFWCGLDQRPEDIARARAALANTRAAVAVSTSFGEPPDRHLAVAELLLQQALRQVERGADAVLLIDSLTALVRAAGRAAPASGRWAVPGVDAAALAPAKRLLAAACECAEGGSLTVVASAVAATGSAVDEAIRAEFACLANSEIAVDPPLARGSGEVSFDLGNTRTRPEDDPRPPDEQQRGEIERARLQHLAEAARAASRAALAGGGDAPPPSGGVTVR